jgi:hypothetical protein
MNLTRCTTCKKNHLNKQYISNTGVVLKTCLACRDRGNRYRQKKKAPDPEPDDEKKEQDIRRNKIIDTLLENNNKLLELLRI